LASVSEFGALIVIIAKLIYRTPKDSNYSFFYFYHTFIFSKINISLIFIENLDSLHILPRNAPSEDMSERKLYRYPG